MSREKITKMKIPSRRAMAARNARRQIEQAKARIASLKQSVKISEKKARDGEPWPGDKQLNRRRHELCPQDSRQDRGGLGWLNCCCPHLS